jgi:hypothetical protein
VSDPSAGRLAVRAGRAGTPRGVPGSPWLLVAEAKVVKNRLHLDLITNTFDGETERLLGLGARRLRDLQAGNSHWTTFADIEGNEFDLIAD